MQESEAFFILLAKAPPIGARGLKEMECTNNVSLDKLTWTVDRAIHMGFGRKIDDGSRAMIFEKSGNQISIANIPTHKDVTWFSVDRL